MTSARIHEGFHAVKPEGLDEYRRKAEDCLHAAARPGLTDADRQRLLRLAVAWQKMAEGLAPRNTATPD